MRRHQERERERNRSRGASPDVLRSERKKRLFSDPTLFLPLSRLQVSSL
jgi:hypothetical protein